MVGAAGRLLNSYVAGFGKGAWWMTMSYPGSRIRVRFHSIGCERRLPGLKPMFNLGLSSFHRHPSFMPDLFQLLTMRFLWRGAIP